MIRNAGRKFRYYHKTLKRDLQCSAEQEHLSPGAVTVVVTMRLALARMRRNRGIRRISISAAITILLYLFFIFKTSRIDSGSARAHGEDFRSNTSGAGETARLVVASTLSENVNWAANGQFTSAIYVVDSQAAGSPFATPINKGNEAMVYLTYIIDHYEHLPDVVIFSHADLRSKHVDELLGSSMEEALRRLNLKKVVRDGYFNLRCNWQPGGCPRYLNLLETGMSKLDGAVQAATLKSAWLELFPDVAALPEWVGQAYGGQFAASRDAIRRLPLSSWVRWRDWLINTNLTNYDSGRVWEYTWQYVLAEKALFCPSMYQCYCEGYGICFESPIAFEEWISQKNALKEKVSEYLLRHSAGKSTLEMKLSLLKENAQLDKFLEHAKTGESGSS